MIEMPVAYSNYRNLLRLDVYFPQLRSQCLPQSDRLPDARGREPRVPEHEALAMPDQITAVRKRFLFGRIGKDIRHALDVEIFEFTTIESPQLDVRRCSPSFTHRIE